MRRPAASATGWLCGFIVEYEQNGADRATYGADIIHRLSADLRARFGRGFSKTNLIYMRKFYLAFRKKSDTSDLFGLTWSHCMEILKCDDSLEVSFYCKECSQSKWSVRKLKRQMKSMLFHRIALSKDKQGVLELARKGASVQRPEDILRDPYVLEFAGLPVQRRYRESQLEKVLLEHLRDFLLELGKGFSFVGSQVRIPLNTSHPCKVDLVFYNFILKCFVLIDLKRGAAEHYDIGQMNMYLNYYKSEVGTKDDAEPVGIILCPNRDELVVKYATQGISNRLFVSRYQLYLPNREQLQAQLESVIGLTEAKGSEK